MDGRREHPPPLLSENTEQNKKRLISWNIKGDPAKDIREHESPFYATENRGLVEIVNDNIHFEYVLFYLREHMVRSGKFSRSNEAHAGKVKSLKVKFPLDDKGSVDVSKQKEIAENYQSVLELRNQVRGRLAELNELLEGIDVFK